MSLGSLARWQSTLFSAIRFTNTNTTWYLRTDIPMSGVITTIISSAVFFQFEYIDGSVIAALAVLETPTSINAEHPQQVGISKIEKVENGPADQSGVALRDRPEDTRQFLRSLRQKFLWDVIPCLCAGLLVHASHYLTSRVEFIPFNVNKGQVLAMYLFIGFLMVKSLFSIPPGSNAFTNQRSLARRHLYSQRGFWSICPGLSVFLVYILLTGLIMILARPIFAEEGHNLFVCIFSRLFFGLLLTNLHTAWVHTVISKPSKKSIWQRTPGWREWIEIIPAASLDIVLPNCVHHLTKRFGASVGYQAFGELPSTQETLGSVIFLAIPVILEYLTSIFTRAIYIRVAASMLPDDDESVIPFDRSFGGRARNNETYCLTIIDAFRTMPLQNWYRYLKIVWEVFCYEYIGILLFAIAIAMQMSFWE